MFQITKNAILSNFIKGNNKKCPLLVSYVKLRTLRTFQVENFDVKKKQSNVLSNNVDSLTNATSSKPLKLELQTSDKSSSSATDNFLEEVCNRVSTTLKSAPVLSVTSKFEDVLCFCENALKTNSPITSNEDLKVIISNVCNEDDLHSLNLSLVLKAIHFSKSERHLIRNDIIKLFNFCTKNKDQLSIQNCTHLCNLMRSSAIYTPHLLDIAFHKLYSELTTARIKDIGRIVTILAYFNHEPTYGLNEVVEEFMSRDKQIEEFPIFLYTILESLCVFGVYPKSLIKKCFEENIINRLLEMKYKIGNVLLTVNTSFAIECYDENKQLLLNKDIKLDKEPVTIEQLLQKPKHLLSNTEKELIYCYSIMKKKFGKKVICTHLLPYLRFPDIVIVDKPNIQQRIGREIRPNAIFGCTAVIVKHRNNYSDGYNKQIKGWHSLKTRLLTTIGYKIIEIPNIELSKLDSQLNGRQSSN